ncbi:hypothetical protein Tsubulata_009117 [Turnera subulata]|uniref:FAD dependent oxidoreductase domain-containing protein n=1 Tax=Turnera subulata TaxID=218843 RepID=A0A516IJE1_9ROSI|nr:hypothetical protein Tsubulata_009117 [Turnera subulata]
MLPGRLLPTSLASKLQISLRSIVTGSSSPSPPMSGLPAQRVVVCGGGVIGACTAYYLSKKAAAVTLVEQSSVACAASGKAGGFLSLDMCDGEPIAALARTGYNLHRSLAQELNGPESYGYRPLTSLLVTVKESSSAQPSEGLPSWVDGPAAGPETVWTAETTAQLHPQLFTRAVLAKAVESYGVEVVMGKVERVGVVEEEEEGRGRVDSVVLAGGRVIEADSVVLALGPWSGKFEMLSSLFRVYGIRTHSIVLEPKNPDVLTPHAVFLDYYPAEGGHMEPEVYARPTGEVYLCGVSSQMEVPDDPEQITVNPESIKVLKRVAGTLSSHLAAGEARVKAEQACFLPYTDDKVPVIGELPGVKGCYVATGHYAWGILTGPSTGAAVAELVLDGQSKIVDLTNYSPARFVGGQRKD